MSNPKTITTFLVDGSPMGVKTIELSNWSGKVIVVPRAKLKDVKNRSEMQNTALYFLFGEDEQGNSLAYIGEAENLFNRIVSHDTNKTFWELMIGFISKDNSLMKGDVRYLESLAIGRAKKNSRYILQNSTTPPENNLTECRVAEMNEFLENIDLLISAIGYPILKEIILSNNQQEGNNLYYLKSRGSDATGIYTEDGMLILAGSVFSKDSTPSFSGTSPHQRRWQIERDEKIFDQVSKKTKLDIVLSPSMSASIIAGNSVNGWMLWKNKEGKTLDEIERKNLQNL